MRLFKFIDEKYNIDNGANSIRIGTFVYYRGMEEESPISDKDEGMALYSSSESKPSVFTEGNIKDIPALDQMFELGGSSSVSFAGVSLAVALPNVCLFCCSALPDNVTEDKLKTIASSLGKETWYEIKNPQEFSEICGRRILETLKLSNLSEGFVNKLSIAELGGFMLSAPHQEVIYKTETSTPMGKNMISPDQMFSERLFTKDIKYKTDLEYRFAFILRHPKFGIINIDSEFIDINISPFHDKCI